MIYRACLQGLIGCVVLAAGLAGAGAGETPPPRKPGLWELTISAEAGAPKSMRLCLDAASEETLSSKGASRADACKSHDAHREGSSYVMDSVCQIMGSEQTAHSVTTFDGDGAYTTVIEAKYAPPFLGNATSRVTQTGKWLGDCGPDLKPGDAVVNGVTVHATPRP